MRCCAVHFRPEDFERDLMNELLGLPVRSRLKRDAVPSLELRRPAPRKEEDPFSKSKLR
jgi:hypothetical protein